WRVQSVHVSAWPAVKLLWGDADSVSVHAGALRVSPATVAKLAHEARGVAKLDASATGARLGPLQLSDLSLRKRGGQLSARAFLSDSALPAVTLMLFSDPSLYVEGVGASRAASPGGVPGYQLSMRARLR